MSRPCSHQDMIVSREACSVAELATEARDAKRRRVSKKGYAPAFSPNKSDVALSLEVIAPRRRVSWKQPPPAPSPAEAVPAEMEVADEDVTRAGAGVGSEEASLQVHSSVGEVTLGSSLALCDAVALRGTGGTTSAAAGSEGVGVGRQPANSETCIASGAPLSQKPSIVPHAAPGPLMLVDAQSRDVLEDYNSSMARLMAAQAALAEMGKKRESVNELLQLWRTLQKVEPF
mmetsp:Transcript_3144/g.12181  ORF Transcript_3144/g.12181 Transcript_3144/m.12181 type:complete len:231 (-) Transcript_3144:314-1006(-)